MDRAYRFVSVTVIASLIAACGGEAVSGTDAGGRLDGAPVPLDSALPDARADREDAQVACPDIDGDGARALACGGTDCDDSDPQRFPNNLEICNQRDEDCNGATLGPDLDGDSFVGATCCNPQPVGDPACGADCNDAMRGVNPGATEACNGLDDDCNGLIDEGVEETFYRDVDGDNAGRSSDFVRGCTAPLGYVLAGGDCDDANRNTNPSAPESCNGIDDNCDGMIDSGPSIMCACRDGETIECGEPDGRNGFLSIGECRVGSAACVGGVRQPCVDAVLARMESEVACNGRDDDCDGVNDNGVDVACFVDSDNDGYAPLGAVEQRLCPSGDPAREPVGFCPFGYTNRRPQPGAIDCADTGAMAGSIRPGAREVCNDLDDDCNDTVDDGTGAKVTCYVDSDGDGFAASTMGMMDFCVCPMRTTPQAPSGPSRTDCNDSVITVHPMAPEICDAQMPPADENCNGQRNEGCSCAPLGATRPCEQSGVCGGGMQRCEAQGTGSVWGTCSVQPSAETCNAMDDNCNGMTDESFACERGSGPLSCTTPCGTPGGSMCLTDCTRDLCRAPSESCNFCDDNADGISDQTQAMLTTSTVSPSSCAAYARSGDANQFCRVVNGADQFGTLRIPGSVRVGYGDVTLRVELEMIDFSDGQRPSEYVELSIGYRQCIPFCIFYGYAVRWYFGGGSETDTFELVEQNGFSSRTIRSTNSLATGFTEFNTGSLFVIATARRIELVFRPSNGAIPGRLTFRDARTGTIVLDESIPSTIIGLGRAVEGTILANTLGGAVELVGGTGGATYLSAAQTCP